MSGARTAQVPASLRPKARPAPAAASLPAVAPVDLPALHLAFVVPDARIQKLLTGQCYLVGPTTQRMRVTVHALLNDKNHQGAALHEWMRWALVETGLVPPSEVGLIVPVEVQLGWANHEKDTA